MAQTYYAILTAIGEAKLANAAALGTTLQLTKMAVGDGNGNTPQPSRDQKALVHETRRAPLNQLSIDPANPSQIVAEQIIPEDVGGWWIRELGLYDAAGDLCAVANCPDTYKPVLSSGSGRTQIIRMVLIVSNTAAVELKVDPSVVLAPRGYVDQVMTAHGAAADPHPQYAKDEDLQAHTAAVDPHPQYFTEDEVDAALKIAMAKIANAAGLTNLLAPSNDGGWRDIYRAGWLPGWFNQQWGGALAGCEMLDALTGKTFRFEPTAGQVQDENFNSFSSAQQFTAGQGFRVSEAQSIDAVWFKLCRTGNVNRVVNFTICADAGGVPGATIANGTGTPLNFLQITSNQVGEWYRIEFPGKPQLQAGTQYHLCASTGVVDNANWVSWRATARSRYPFGALSQVTSAGVWSAYPGTANCFLIEPSAASRWLQPGGFDQKLVFAQGAPVAQSKLLCQPVRGYFDGKSGTILYRGATPANSVLYDVGAGIDHDRLVLGTTAQGYPVATLYRADRSTVSVTGTASIAAGTHDVAVGYRCVGDGADYLRLYVDGVAVGQPLTAQTFAMTEGWRDLATSWLGGGFPLAPVWDAASLQSFAALPSTAGWAWTGGTEANAMSVVAGRLFQNKNGFGATDKGYYARAAAGFNNAIGWAICWRNRVQISGGNLIAGQVGVAVNDGSTNIQVLQHENFIEIGDSANGFSTVQYDCRSTESEYLLTGCGSDVYLFANGRLLFDGTSRLKAPISDNSVIFGDLNNASGENADVIWTAFRFYTGGMLLPKAATGATLSEFAYWSGDQSGVLASLFGNGTPISVRKLCGLGHGYVGEGTVQREIRRGLTNGLSTTSTTPIVMAEIEAFVIGSDLVVDASANLYNGGSAYNFQQSYVDGGAIYSPEESYSSSSAMLGHRHPVRVFLGLHKVESRWSVTGGTGYAYGSARNMTVEARS